MTLREAGRRLGITADRVRGMADALGIDLAPVGRAFVMNEDEFEKIRKAMTRASRAHPATAAN